ncbi:MAG: LLM class flavin-dependent oxidoreductase [Dehalococcoidia bacterium]
MERTGVTIMAHYFGRATEVIDLGAELDQAGVPEIFVTESVNEAPTTLTALALRTSRATIGSAIAIIFLRHPHTLATAAATIDELAGGRLVLGIGTGHPGMIRDKFGLSLDQPLQQMREYLACLRGGMDASRDRNDVGGEHFQIRGSRINWAAERRIPIVLAALSDGMVRLAATEGDGIMTSLAPVEQIARFRRLLDESAAAAGRAPAEIRLYTVVHVCLRPTRDEARAVVREGIGYSSSPFYQRELERAGYAAPGGRPDDRTIDAITIAGPEEYARERLAELWALGAIPLLAPVGGEPDIAAAYRSFVPLIVEEGE